jgi:hypothetical protein
LRALFAIAIAGKEEFLSSGVWGRAAVGILGRPPSRVTPATNNLFSYADAANMISRFKAYLGAGRFFMHPGVFPDVATWEVGTAGAGLANIASLGYGTQIFSEHLPQANNSGDVIWGLKVSLLRSSGLTVDFERSLRLTGLSGGSERIDGQLG